MVFKIQPSNSKFRDCILWELSVMWKEIYHKHVNLSGNSIKDLEVAAQALDSPYPGSLPHCSSLGWLPSCIPGHLHWSLTYCSSSDHELFLIQLRFRMGTQGAKGNELTNDSRVAW